MLTRKISRSPQPPPCAHNAARPQLVTWHHRSRDHSIRNIPFTIGGSLEPSFCLQPFSYEHIKRTNTHIPTDTTVERYINSRLTCLLTYYKRSDHIFVKVGDGATWARASLCDVIGNGICNVRQLTVTWLWWRDACWDVQVLRAMGNSYHVDCFRCHDCRLPLHHQPFTVDVYSRPHCITDYVR